MNTRSYPSLPFKFFCSVSVHIPGQTRHKTADGVSWALPSPIKAMTCRYGTGGHLYPCCLSVIFPYSADPDGVFSTVLFELVLLVVQMKDLLLGIQSSTGFLLFDLLSQTLHFLLHSRGHRLCDEGHKHLCQLPDGLLYKGLCPQ